jgi:hypothetical protein
MSKFTFETIFIPWTYLSRVPGKKKVLFVIQKFKNFIIFLQFSFGKASYFCVHAINFGPIIMSNFTFEAIFIPWTYLSRVPGKKKINFLKTKILKNSFFFAILLWKSFFLCPHVINFGQIIMHKFNFEVILILRVYLSRMWSKRIITFSKRRFYMKILWKLLFFFFFFYEKCFSFAWYTTQIYSKDQNDLKIEFVHNYLTKIYHMRTQKEAFPK